MNRALIYKSIVAASAATVLSIQGPVMAAEHSTGTPLPDDETMKLSVQKSYSPYVGRNFPTKPLWGDTHLHTDASLDAYTWGGRLGAKEAYRFARGEEVRATDGCEFACPGR